MQFKIYFCRTCRRQFHDPYTDHMPYQITAGMSAVKTWQSPICRADMVAFFVEITMEDVDLAVRGQLFRVRSLGVDYSGE